MPKVEERAYSAVHFKKGIKGLVMKYRGFTLEFKGSIAEQLLSETSCPVVLRSRYVPSSGQFALGKNNKGEKAMLTYYYSKTTNLLFTWVFLLFTITLFSLGCKPPIVPLDKKVTVSVAMVSSEIVPDTLSSAIGIGEITVGTTGSSARAISGEINLTGMTAGEVMICEAYAGDSGFAVVSLEVDSTDPNLWRVPPDTVLTQSDMDSLWAGALYITATSDSYPDGEIRGQLLTDNINLFFVEMDGTDEVPAATTSATGIAAVTLNEATGELLVHLNSAGLVGGTAADISNAPAGSNGPLIVTLDQDSSDSSHWYSSLTPFDDLMIAALVTGEHYVNLHSASYPDGEIRGQITAFELNSERAAIEKMLQTYAVTLDWPRGATGWEASFNPIWPPSWPKEQWHGGYELFQSLFAHDAVLDYESLCMLIEADLPETTIRPRGFASSCPILGLKLRGSLDFFYYGITIGTQLSCTTEITPVSIDIVGDKATSEDSYIHKAVLNHHLTGDMDAPETQTGNHYGDWARDQKWVWEDNQWKSGWKITHWGGVVNEL